MTVIPTSHEMVAQLPDQSKGDLSKQLCYTTYIAHFKLLEEGHIWTVTKGKEVLKHFVVLRKITRKLKTDLVYQ